MVQKVCWGEFFPSYRNIGIQTGIGPLQNICNLICFDIVTLDGHDLTRDHNRLICISYTIHAVSSALFPLEAATLHGKASDDK